MTYGEFKSKYLGNFIDQDGVYSYQCVDVIKQWISDNGWPMKSGNAIDWQNNGDDFYKWIPNTPSGVPNQGDIIVFSTGTYGHIGVVESANVNTVDVLNQNYPKGNCTDPVQVTRFNYTKPKVVGWLHPKALDAPVTPPEDPKDARIRQLESELSVSKTNVINLSNEVNNLNSRLQTITTEKESALKEIVELNKTISDNAKTHATELSTCEKAKDDLIAQKSDWLKEMADYDKKYYLIPRDLPKKVIHRFLNFINRSIIKK